MAEVAVITATELADALTHSLISVVHRGQPRVVRDVEFMEQGDPATVGPGDLVLAVGFSDVEPLLELVERAGRCAGLVVRGGMAVDGALVAACRDHGLTLLTLEPGVAWSHVVWLMRGYVDRAGLSDGLAPPASTIYSDLFATADALSSIVQAPVTIEDAHSRVLAYSVGQDDVDHARLSTIVGRKVPPGVLAHFRSRGVFRQLARSDEAIFVPEGPDGVKPRFVLPVRAGSEWLGSIWAVVEEPVPDQQQRELRAATDVLALHLLRLRAQSDFSLQLPAGRLRALLDGTSTTAPAGLGDGPWRVVALGGLQAGETVETRRLLWAALFGRRGWRLAQLTDLDDVIFAIVTDGPQETPGSWRWLRKVVLAELDVDDSLTATAGGSIDSVAELPGSSRLAAEQLGLGAELLGGAVTAAEDCWAQVTVQRAVAHLGRLGPAGPLGSLRDHDRHHGSSLVATLREVLAYWGEPQRAARVLGIHPNSVRNRTARILDVAALDLDDPVQRLALQLQLAADRGRGTGHEG